MWPAHVTKIKVTCGYYLATFNLVFTMAFLAFNFSVVVYWQNSQL